MNPNDAHLEKLLDAYFEGAMDPEMRRDLDQLITSAPHVRARFWKRATMECALECWAEKSRGESIAFPKAALRAPSHRHRRLPMIAGLSAAAAAVVMITWLLNSPPESPGSPPAVAVESPVVTDPSGIPLPPTWIFGPVAYISRVGGLPDGTNLKQGHSLSAGREVTLTSGLLAVDFFSGARVSIQGPARFVPESDMRLTVREGVVQVDVPDSAKGFVLALPDGTVTDFGTSFEAVVSNNGTSRLQVSGGEIELADLSGRGAPKRMFKGEAVSLAADGGLKPIDFKALKVKDSLEDRNADENKSRAQKWEEYCAGLERDPSVLVHFRFLPEEEGSREIINRAGHPNSPASGTVIAAEWVRGRWQGKKALAFHGYADRVTVDIQGEYPEVTYLAWVKADNLPLRYNGLFLSEANIQGEAHWQFSPEGAFMFSVRPRGEGIAWRFHRAFSKPVLFPSDFGSWHFLGTTYDAKRREVVHFVDGREVHRVLLDDSVPVRFGRATLGNFHDPTPAEHANVPGLGKEWSFRNWSGSIDEFLLFSRVLEPQEIQRLHEVGVAE